MKILIFAGPSGGHLFPALAFGDAFRKKHPGTEISVVVTPKISPFLKAWVLAGDNKIFFLQDFHFPPIFSLKAPAFLLKLAQGFLESRKIVNEVKPDLIVTFGTFVGFAGVILGNCKSLPTLIHEQNIELGRANRMLIPFARKVAVSFPSTLDRLPRGKGTCVGNIVRPEMVEALSKPKPRAPKTQILVLGGSQGASRLNSLIFQTFKRLSPEEKQNLAVTHITGVIDFPKFEHAYDELGIENEVFPFSDEMPGLYAAADLVIARAGAGTLFEIALFGLPSILIPYPHAASHQLANARFFSERNAASLLEEQTLTPERLKSEMFSLLKGTERARAMSASAAKFGKPDAALRMVEIAEEMIGAKGGVR